MHFTYEAPSKADLQQGDLVKRTPAVDQLLKEIHPHYFTSTAYRFFLVLTQSCDLVRRAGKSCKSRYISIAAVRPLRTAIEREVEKLQLNQIERSLGFCSEERKAKLTQFMERLLNNNEEDYFYFHREPDFGLPDSHCAFLHLSIALKAQLHYETLLTARILSLTESFQHKLGYLIGSLYSRVGTEDWNEKQPYAEQFKTLTTQPAKDSELVLWLEKDIHKKVLDILKDVANPNPEDLQNAIDQTHKTKETRKADVLTIIGNVLADLGVPEDIRKKARTRLENHSEFSLKIR